MAKPDIKHESGPFAEISTGDVIQVIYDGAQVALVQITQVKQHALKGLDGTSPCKITKLSDTDLRLYADLGPNRTSVLRQIKIRKVEKN